jgi:hypothetical protein
VKFHMHLIFWMGLVILIGWRLIDLGYLPLIVHVSDQLPACRYYQVSLHGNHVWYASDFQVCERSLSDMGLKQP